jgi:hypothetical protein
LNCQSLCSIRDVQRMTGIVFMSRVYIVVGSIIGDLISRYDAEAGILCGKAVLKSGS